MKIGNKNVSDWGIVTAFDIGEAPAIIKKYKVPGRHGSRDASEALTGYPIYDDRPVSMEVYIKRKTPEEYQAVYDEINGYCHGKIRAIAFPFDKDYYYEGRLNVKIQQEDNSHGTVLISAECYPYALKKELTEIDLSSETGEEREIVINNAGMPTKLQLVTDAEITIVRGNMEKTYKSNTIIYAPLLVDSETIKVSGIANAKIIYQEGKL